MKQETHGDVENQQEESKDYSSRKEEHWFSPKGAHESPQIDLETDSAVKNCWSFAQQVSFRLEFREKRLRKQFYLFRVASTSPLVGIIIAVFVTITFICFWTLFFLNVHTLPLIFLAIVSFIFSVALFWVVVYSRVVISVKAQQSIYRKYFILGETLVTYSFTLTTCLVALFRAFNTCSSLSFVHIFSCSTGRSFHDIPMDITFIILNFPFIFYLIFPFLTIGHALINLAISIVFTLFYTIYFESYVAADWVILNVLFSVFIMLLYRMQSMELFFFTTRYYEMIKNQSSEERALAEKLSHEMRQLIASVAHDLKSPLSAFIQGFESLRDSMNEFGKLVMSLSPDVCGTYRQPFLQGIGFMKRTIDSLVGTYHSFLMTINRCTDYTKISHGIPLTPVLEKVNIREAILTPIGVVKDLQGKVCVESDIDTNISDYVITDRQWLQDNLLCLISNAVKYSIEETSFVRVFLLEEHVDLTVPSQETKDIKSIDKFLCFQVEDFGVGIANTITGKQTKDPNLKINDEDLAQCVFQDPHFDFNQKRDIGGSGLGLRCLAKRTEALQGKYGVASKSGKEQGTIIWFTIPYFPTVGSMERQEKPSGGIQSPPDESFFDIIAERSNKQSSGRLKSAAKEEHTSNIQRQVIQKVSFPTNIGDFHEKDDEAPLLSSLENSLQPHILVVDDSLPILKMLQLVLEKHGYRVTRASNGLEAVEKFVELQDQTSLRQRRKLPLFDAILMDIQMPIMTGIEATKRIREIERSLTPESSSIHYSPSLHHLIVAMSATTDNITISEAYEIGIDEFLPKPFQLQAFENIMRQYHKLISVKESSSH